MFVDIITSPPPPLPSLPLPQHATRKVYGEALVKLGKNYERIIALDGDTKNSTFSLTYKNAFPNRYVECFIAEQNICSVGIGLACRDRNIVFCSTFAAFFTRAFDQIRMGAISMAQVNFVGSHAGCSIGEDRVLHCPCRVGVSSWQSISSYC